MIVLFKKTAVGLGGHQSQRIVAYTGKRNIQISSLHPLISMILIVKAWCVKMICFAKAMSPIDAPSCSSKSGDYNVKRNME